MSIKDLIWQTIQALERPFKIVDYSFSYNIEDAIAFIKGQYSQKEMANLKAELIQQFIRNASSYVIPRVYVYQNSTTEIIHECTMMNLCINITTGLITFDIIFSKGKGSETINLKNFVPKLILVEHEGRFYYGTMLLIPKNYHFDSLAIKRLNETIREKVSGRFDVCTRIL